MTEWIVIKERYGFTLLEVMVTLAIVGISLGIFFNLIGNSARLKGKMDSHAKSLLFARLKTEEAFLGILGEQFIPLNERKVYKGITKDGVQWEVVEIDTLKEFKQKLLVDPVFMEKSLINNTPPGGIISLRTHIEGININTLFFSDTEEDSASELDREDGEKDVHGESSNSRQNF
ncbi:MAG: prepilin-type N-terminal cleavage/methylation domain-containing protein [Candidatus Brocadiaceae bacterium]|nr:prepilin-type N-terminal cleavage/methylation domain-containing protein [Candidatus Brocadiaceae bacterium]